MHSARSALLCLALCAGALNAQDAPATLSPAFEAGISTLLAGHSSTGLSLALPVHTRERLRIHLELTGFRGERPRYWACGSDCEPPQPVAAFSLGTAGVRAVRTLPARFIVVADAALVYGRWATEPAAVSAVTSAASVGLGRESRRRRFAADLRLQWLDTPTAATIGSRLSLRFRW